MKLEKLALGALSSISNHPASFIAGTTLISSAVIRPMMINLAPNVDKENKKYLKADAIASSASKFLIAEAIALPVENAIKNIEKNPAQYLSKDTIKNFSNNKDFKFASQFLKLSASLLSAIPKSILSIALIPLVVKLFDKKNEKKSHDISFKGAIEKQASGIFNSSSFQKFIKKHSQNSQNIARNMAILTDITLAATSVIKTKTSKKIDEKNKNPLIYNKLISSASSILLGFSADKYAQKLLKPSIDNFIKKYKNDPALDKYLQGINVLRPTIIFAILYYMILPVISAAFADKIDKAKNGSSNVSTKI